MRYCKKCTMPDTRPGITFDSEGVCSACRHYENRKNVDWDARFKEFEAYCDKYRGMNGPGGYDCAVAVSGGKDSHFQVWMLKEVMHMNPILFSVEDNFPMTQAGIHNLKNISEEFGCTIISCKPNIRAQKVLMRKFFEKYGKPTWYVDRLIYTFPLHMAAKFNTPMLCYGENVSFEYPDDHNKVLHDISLDIHAGERLALVGASGGGKTTLCNLIPRFYEVTDGRILIDGQDIRHVTLKSLRQDIGIVQQDVYLFSGTVAQNIAYGKPGATREEIVEAARLAGAERFILALKDGFDTYVGERGVKLSGGQKQRIAIARVFLKNPPILILDEATSALDNESEILVGQSLEKLAHGRTTLTIAHRLTTIKDYDRILVLGEEGIVESGTHEQLLAKQGVYYRLWNQLPGEDTL